MKAIYSNVDKECRRQAGIGSKLNVAQLAGSTKPRKICPQCLKQEAILLDRDRQIIQGGVIIYARQLFCLDCKKLYMTPV